jgi:hypothetical protein
LLTKKRQNDMKKAIQILVILFVILVPVILTAQPLPYGGEGVGGGEGAAPVGGAPIGGGLLIMLSLAIGYGAKKIYDIRKKVLD